MKKKQLKGNLSLYKRSISNLHSSVKGGASNEFNCPKPYTDSINFCRLSHHFNCDDIDDTDDVDNNTI